MEVVSGMFQPQLRRQSFPWMPGMRRPWACACNCMWQQQQPSLPLPALLQLCQLTMRSQVHRQQGRVRVRLLLHPLQGHQRPEQKRQLLHAMAEVGVEVMLVVQLAE